MAGHHNAVGTAHRHAMHGASDHLGRVLGDFKLGQFGGIVQRVVVQEKAARTTEIRRDVFRRLPLDVDVVDPARKCHDHPAAGREDEGAPGSSDLPQLVHRREASL